MTMKSVFAVVLMIVVFVTGSALAETVTQGSYAVTIPDSLDVYDTAEEEPEMVYCTGNDSMELQIYSFESNGISMEDYIAEYAQDLGGESGETTINGIKCGYVVYTDEDDYGKYTGVSYVVEDNGMILEFDFFLDEETANEIVLEIMNSLKK